MTALRKLLRQRCPVSQIEFFVLFSKLKQLDTPESREMLWSELKELWLRNYYLHAAVYNVAVSVIMSSAAAAEQMFTSLLENKRTVPNSAVFYRFLTVQNKQINKNKLFLNVFLRLKCLSCTSPP